MFRYLHTSHQGGHVKVALVFRFGTPVPEKVRLRRAGSTHKNSHRSQLASGIYCDCLCSEKPANINTLSCARLLLAPLVTVDVSSMLTPDGFKPFQVSSFSHLMFLELILSK